MSTKKTKATTEFKVEDLPPNLNIRHVTLSKEDLSKILHEERKDIIPDFANRYNIKYNGYNSEHQATLVACWEQEGADYWHHYTIFMDNSDYPTWIYDPQFDRWYGCTERYNLFAEAFAYLTEPPRVDVMLDTYEQMKSLRDGGPLEMVKRQMKASQEG